MTVGSADITEGDNTEIKTALIECDEGARGEIESADIVHEMGVVYAGGNRGKRIKAD